MVSTVKLEARNLTFGYNPAVPVVKDVSLTVEAGEVVFILGHNGGGKTSLLSCLCGVLQADTGRIEIDGVDLESMSPTERAKRIGMIPQMHEAVFGYTVLDVVLMGRAPHLSQFAAPARIDREIALESLDRVGLSDFHNRRYAQLSGGERRMVMVARGLTQRCDVLLMDEPDAHLDPRNQLRVLEVVHDLAREHGLAFVVTSHSPNSALMFAGRVLLMRHGSILSAGPVESTMTETVLGEAYSMPIEVISKVVDGRRVPRAVLPRRVDVVPDEVKTVAVEPEALLQPDSMLARLMQASVAHPQRVIVTGPRGSGKSRWCDRLVKAARPRGLSVGGVHSEAVFVEDHKVAIDLVDLASGERQRLANVRRGGTDGGNTTERWRFLDDTLNWGNDVLRRAGKDEFDILVIDELGLLELHRATGFIAGLEAVDNLSRGVAVAVVRPSLLESALQRWPDAVVIDVED